MFRRVRRTACLFLHGRSPRVSLCLAAVNTVESLEGRRLLANDFGDAPDTYGTTLAAGGARAIATPNLVLGKIVDAEADGQPSLNAQRDDANGLKDDEDGITFLDPIAPGATTKVQVELGAGAGLLNAWLDFNQNGVFDNPSERIFSAVGVPTGLTVLSFVTPAAATLGNTFARFRLSQPGVGSPGPTGASEFGEVEDYQVTIKTPSTEPLDWGDAPDTYRTKSAVGGPSHQVTPNIFLGGKIDAEPDGIPTAGANGDDSSGSDDEDGIVFLDPIIPGSPTRVNVITGASGGRINGWIDFNRNGVFEPAIETVFSNVAVPGASTTTLSFVTPSFAVAGGSYSRWRLTFNALTAGPWGPGGFGEVEDHPVTINRAPQRKLDFGDAPDSYGTLLASNGARHWVTPNLHLGKRIDAESDGQPNLAANGDDSNAAPDEDGIVFLDPISPGALTKVQVTNGAAAGDLNAWLDFNGNGAFDPATETIFSNVPLAAASVTTLSFTSPGATVPGVSYARFRLTFKPSTVGPKGFDNFGEVEDYVVKIRERDLQEWDWGDAPTFAAVPGYPTIAVNNGARHAFVAQMPRLGGRWDSEPNGQPTIDARGDDNNGIDDEDGVMIGATPLDFAALVPGTIAPLTVKNGGNTGGLVNAWVDWNRNFTWDPGEQIATDLPVAAAASSTINVTVPATITPGPVYFRFRISTASGLAPTGAAKDGEVEDYAVKVRETPTQGSIDWGDAPSKTQFGTSFPTLASENGAAHNFATGQPILGTLRDAEADGQPTGTALGDDNTISDDEDGVYDAAGLPLDQTILYAGQKNTIVVNMSGGSGYLNGWVDANQDGDWDDAGEHFIVDDFGTGSRSYTLALPNLSGKAIFRFRVSSQAGLDYSGLAKDGEVEDYLVPTRDYTGPTTSGAGLQYQTRTTFSVLFDEPIDPSSLDVGDVVAINRKTGQRFTPTAVTYDPETQIASFSWGVSNPMDGGPAAAAGDLPDGDYTFELVPGGITDLEGNMNPQAEDAEGGEFFLLTGDTNHDRTVNFDDLLTLAKHYGQKTGGTYDIGDLDRDGDIDFDDLLLLAKNYNATLPDPTAASPAAADASLSVTPTRKRTSGTASAIEI